MHPRETEVIEGLLEAYREGAFPMADPRSGRMEWFSPDPRALLPLEFESARDTHDHSPRFHVSRSLAARVRSRRFHITTDLAFETVIRSCGEERPKRDESWIDDRIIWAYSILHRAGHAHSIEAWLPSSPLPDQPPELVGGIYGVSIGAAFFAESMFCRPELGYLARPDTTPVRRPGTDASKVCLVHLVAHLRARGYVLLDVQLRNDHTDQFGVYEIPRREYLKRLEHATSLQTSWTPFDPNNITI